LHIKDVYSKKSVFGFIEIIDNGYIGFTSIMLPDATVSNNSIVAAGRVVKGILKRVL